MENLRYSDGEQILLLNLFYSLRSMFMGNQNFPGLWGSNFVGSVIGIIFTSIIQMIVYRFVGM